MSTAERTSAAWVANALALVWAGLMGCGSWHAQGEQASPAKASPASATNSVPELWKAAFLKRGENFEVNDSALSQLALLDPRQVVPYLIEQLQDQRRLLAWAMSYDPPWPGGPRPPSQQQRVCDHAASLLAGNGLEAGLLRKAGPFEAEAISFNGLDPRAQRNTQIEAIKDWYYRKGKWPCWLLVVPRASGATNSTAATQEMKYFNPQVGFWRGRIIYEGASTGASTEASTSEWIGAFITGGHLFEIRGLEKSRDGIAHFRWVMTYDRAARAYRAWIFDMTGHVTGLMGTRDATGKRINWSSEPGGNSPTNYVEIEVVNTRAIRTQGAAQIKPEASPLRWSVLYRKAPAEAEP